jgi:hypothetical protein
MDNPFSKDRRSWPSGTPPLARDGWLRGAAQIWTPGRAADRRAAPHPHRKTLGGLQTDLSGRVLGRDYAHRPVPGCSRRAGGRVRRRGHARLPVPGKSFLGGCLFSGRQAGRAVAIQTSG